MLNLHAIVRTPITALHPDETVTLFRSIGQTNIKGRIIPTYADGVLMQAQIQTLTADELQQREETSKTGFDAKCYLFADEEYPAAGIVRHLSRNGDFMCRADGTWWLVVSVLEDFTKSGWECVGLALQLTPPNFQNFGAVLGLVEDGDNLQPFGQAPLWSGGVTMGAD